MFTSNITKITARLSCAAIILLATSPAHAIEETVVGEALPLRTLEISKQGDLEMPCGPLSAEAANMRDIIHTMQTVKNSSEMQSHGLMAVGAVASFLVGTATGGIGLAVGGFLLDYNIDEREDNADKYQDLAEQRRTLMMGIYNAKGCNGPLEHAMQNPKEFSTLASLSSENESKYQTELRTRYNK